MTLETGMASLHAGLILRARPVAARPPERPERTVQPLRADLVRRVAPPPAPVAKLVAFSRSHAMPRQRFGLTVRVGQGLHGMLFRTRRRTGQTTQDILHAALVRYLAESD